MVRNSDHSSTVQSIKVPNGLANLKPFKTAFGESLLREAGQDFSALICGSSDAHRGKGQAKRRPGEAMSTCLGLSKVTMEATTIRIEYPLNLASIKFDKANSFRVMIR